MKYFRTIMFSALVLLLAVSCASIGNSYFAGTIGGVFLTSDDYVTQTAEINNELSEFKSTLWMYNKNYSFLKPETTGNKVVFYSDLEEAGFDNALVPANYRATSAEDAGFIIIAEETEGVFYNEYTFQSGLKCKVYKGAGVLKLYSIKTGELLYTSEKTVGPEPPKQLSVYGNPAIVTYDCPANSAFSSKIKNICNKISSGNITKAIPDKALMEAAGVEIKEKKKEANTSLIGTWTAKDGNETLTYKFTDMGIAVYEYYTDGVLFSAQIIPFSFDQSNIILDGDEMNYNISGKNMTIEMYSDDLVFRQTSKKVSVSNDISKLYGVWTEKNYDSSITMGIAKNGFSIFYGTTRGMSDWKADSSTITFTDYYRNGENSFWIVDDALYIEDNGYFGEYETLKFTRKTSGGKDGTSSSILTSQTWDYIVNYDLEQTDLENLSGDSFTFSANGTFKDIPFHGNRKDPQKSGTYSFANHVIELSDGRSLTFAYIDNIAIGYSF